MASIRFDFTPAKLTTLLSRFLADKDYGHGITAPIGPKRFAREVLHEPQYEANHVFRQQRECVRGLQYADDNWSIERHVIIDESGRKWSVTTEHRRRWYLVCEPYVRGRSDPSGLTRAVVLP